MDKPNTRVRRPFKEQGEAGASRASCAQSSWRQAQQPSCAHIARPGRWAASGHLAGADLAKGRSRRCGWPTVLLFLAHGLCARRAPESLAGGRERLPLCFRGPVLPSGQCAPDSDSVSHSALPSRPVTGPLVQHTRVRQRVAAVKCAESRGTPDARVCRAVEPKPPGPACGELSKYAKAPVRLIAVRQEPNRGPQRLGRTERGAASLPRSPRPGLLECLSSGARHLRCGACAGRRTGRVARLPSASAGRYRPRCAGALRAGAA